MASISTVHQAGCAGAYYDETDCGNQKVAVPRLVAPGEENVAPQAKLSRERRLKREVYTDYFIQHLLRFSMASVSFGLSCAGAVISGGTGIPLAVVTGMGMIVAAGDACCALYNLIEVRNGREPLTQGTDSVFQAVKALMKYCGYSQRCAEITGDIASFSIRVGMAISSLLLPSAHLSGSIADQLSKISTGITAILTLVGGGVDMCTTRVERKQGEAGDRDDAGAVAGPAQHKTRLSEDEIQAMVGQIVACYERFQAQSDGRKASPAW